MGVITLALRFCLPLALVTTPPAILFVDVTFEFRNTLLASPFGTAPLLPQIT